MKIRIQYLDNGFFTLSGKAAGALARAAGLSVPRPGFQLRIPTTEGDLFLQRTPTSLRARAWSWAIHGPGTHLAHPGVFNVTPTGGKSA